MGNAINPGTNSNTYFILSMEFAGKRQYWTNSPKYVAGWSPVASGGKKFRAYGDAKDMAGMLHHKHHKPVSIIRYMIDGPGRYTMAISVVE